MGYVKSVLDCIGRTPLLKLNRIGRDLPARVYVKLEHLNPSGSYKDRMAKAMIEAAERGDTWNGKRLRPGGTVCDSSAGNTAPALALVCACKGYKAKLFMHDYAFHGDSVRMKITSAFGPRVVPPSPPERYLPQDVVGELLREYGDMVPIMAAKRDCYDLEQADHDVVWVDQIYNEHNYKGQMGIGYEILEQLNGEVHAFGCSVGSGATLLGTATALEEKGVRLDLTFGIVPSGSEVYMHLESDECDRSGFHVSDTTTRLAAAMGVDKWVNRDPIVSTLLEAGYPDVFFRITAEEARDMANRLAREEGIYCGMSSGANVAVATEIAKRLGGDKNVVTVIVDRRDRYLSEYPDDIYIV